ncbi:hypothetical protein [Pendulispora albinea]|uniref:ABC transporter permease n=1 Tax=Pendulispora albinea TaxID=2741071 RepID=A0ABZ2LZA0_9BACT
MAEKRRLPLLKENPHQPAPGSDEERRPAWHWVGFGVVIILAAWLPLAYVAEFVKGRVITAALGPVESQDQATLAIAALSSGERARLTAWLVALPAVALSVGALAGGYVVGRWSDKAGWREAGAAGAVVGILTGVLAFASGTMTPAALLPIALTAVLAALGGRRGSLRKGA